MRYTKWFATFALAAGMAVMGAPAASAQSAREVRHDLNRVERLRDQVARDRARLAADLRRGDRWAAARSRARLQQREAELRAMMRETRRDARDYNRGYDTDRFGNGYRR